MEPFDLKQKRFRPQPAQVDRLSLKLGFSYEQKLAGPSAEAREDVNVPA